MDHLARAVVDALAFLALSGEDGVHPDDVVRAMEMLSADLRECSPAERQALVNAASAELAARSATGNDVEMREFYETFEENLFADE